MAYAEIRPVRVADLLSREGHPLAARLTAARAARETEQRDADPASGARRTLGVAAGAMLVLGTVVAGALGLNHGPTSAPVAAGEPLGAAPSHQPVPGGPKAAAPVAPEFTNAADNSPATEDASTAGPAGQIGRPAHVLPPQQPAPAPQRQVAPKPPAAQQPLAPAPVAPAPQQQQAAGPVQTVTEPVAQTVGGGTLSGTLAPVTSTVDDALAPALSLIGGLLGG